MEFFLIKKIFIIIIIILIIDFLVAKIYKKPKVFYVDNSKMSYNAQTIPPLGIFIQKEDAQNKMLKEHELIHWKQYRKTGFILFYVRYLTEYFFLGYDKHPMEIEARVETGEKEECLENMTMCVREGKAKTVYDKNFRK